MKRGRLFKSQIRQNIIEILYYLGRGYGYQISKIYNAIFPQVTQRVIYYHLRKGSQIKEIEMHSVEKEVGDFSWGTSVEKVYYTIGQEAEPKGEKKVKDFLEKRK